MQRKREHIASMDAQQPRSTLLDQIDCAGGEAAADVVERVEEDEEEKELVLDDQAPRNLDGSTQVRTEYGHYGGTLHGKDGRQAWFMFNWNLLAERFSKKFPDKLVFGKRRLRLVNVFDGGRSDMQISAEFNRFIDDAFEVYQTKQLVSYEARSNGFKSRNNFLTKRDHPERGEAIESNDQKDGTACTLREAVKKVRYVSPPPPKK